MKVYVDANIYVSYLLGQRDEEMAFRTFRKGVSCAFVVVGSDILFAEVQQVCSGGSTILLQRLVDELKGAEKLLIVRQDREVIELACSLNRRSGGRYGRNDYCHALLAQRHADIFLTNDGKFKPEASKLVKTRLLPEFLSEL